MSYLIKKLQVPIFILLACIFSANTTQEQLDIQPDELKRMSTFLSNFTEIGLMDFNVQDIAKDDLIMFGIWHNYKNNYNSRISLCKTKDCNYGSLALDKKHVTESIMKYFAINFTDHSGEGYDGKVYHFDGADGDLPIMTHVKKVYRHIPGQFRMTGDIYVIDHDGVTEIIGSFEAYAKPYKYAGKDTWSIISFKGEIL